MDAAATITLATASATGRETATRGGRYPAVWPVVANPERASRRSRALAHRSSGLRASAFVTASSSSGGIRGCSALS